MSEPLSALKQFLKTESAGGLVLMGAALLAIICANTPLAGLYEAFLHVSIGDGAGHAKSVEWFINDGLMAIFFLLVGLEIKREVMGGELSSLKQASLPLIAACGGVAMPAILFCFINQENAMVLHGWAVPTATDIAFALGVLALFGSRVPLSLKVFLTAVAVIDDLIAILIIALFYTEQLSGSALTGAGLCLLGLLVLNLSGMRSTMIFMMAGLALWYTVLLSEVHATLAGVALGLMIPSSILTQLEHRLHPWVAFGILPLFAFANAGISFTGLSPQSLLEPLTLGIAAGLFAGKQIGIALACLLAMRLGVAAMPTGANWRQLYAICVLCGVGFTMSLFIGMLAFDSPLHLLETRLGVIVGSTLSALLACLLLARSLPKRV